MTKPNALKENQNLSIMIDLNIDAIKIKGSYKTDGQK